VDLSLKQRIIGIVVIVILVIVLIPLLFTSSQRVVKKTELSTSMPSPPKKPVIKKPAEKKTTQAWVIQLGTFSNKTNANNLIKKLQNKGFTAYIKKQKSADKAIYQVFVGPEIEHEKAKEVLQNLQNTFQLKGLIVRYKV
jgi:DedD protein